jgi:hypothetical protein
MRKALDRIKPTPELIAYYKRVGDFLRKHKEIKFKALKLGFEVDTSTIPKSLITEWLNVTEIKYNDN